MERKLTLKHKTRSPTFTLSHSEGSKGIERSRTPHFTFTHSSSSLSKPANRTRTSWCSRSKMFHMWKSKTTCASFNWINTRRKLVSFARLDFEIIKCFEQRDNQRQSSFEAYIRGRKDNQKWKGGNDHTSSAELVIL